MKNLEGLYRAVCILTTEIPCGYTAAAVASLVMAVQESTIRNSNTVSTAEYRIHACLLSIMTLICWIHDATDYYKYFSAILDKRAVLAPS